MGTIMVEPAVSEPLNAGPQNITIVNEADGNNPSARNRRNPLPGNGSIK